MKRTCSGCRAEGLDGHCDLGYETKVKDIVMGVLYRYKPAEECPKPLTYNAYFASERKEGKNNEKRN